MPGTSTLSAVTLKRPLSPRARLPALLFLAAIPLALLFAVLQGRYDLRAISLLYGLSPGHTPYLVRLYMGLPGRGFTLQDTTIQSSAGNLAIRTYTPLNTVHAPVILIVHGLVETGDRNPQLNNVARRLANSGYQVVIPDLPASKRLLMRASDLDVIGAAANWSASTYGQRVSLFGVSFGGGLAIAAAEIPAYATNIKMVFSLSGYDSIPRLGSYYLHDPVFSPDGTPYPTNAHWLHALLIARQHVEEMVPEKDANAIEGAIVGVEVARGGDMPRILATLTPAQRQLFLNLRDVQSPATHALYIKMIQTHQAELAAISPQTNLASLKPQLFVAHGITDTAIPLGEAEWMQQQISPSSHAHFLYTSRLGHATLNRLATRWQMLRLIPFVARALKFASDNR